MLMSQILNEAAHVLQDTCPRNHTTKNWAGFDNLPCSAQRLQGQMGPHSHAAPGVYSPTDGQVRMFPEWTLRLKGGSARPPWWSAGSEDHLPWFNTSSVFSALNEASVSHLWQEHDARQIQLALCETRSGQVLKYGVQLKHQFYCTSIYRSLYLIVR